MIIQRIVVVEDDMIIRMFISRTLKAAGYEVSCQARDFASTLNCVEKHQPDLVLMDIGLSGEFDGVDTAKMLRERYEVPIVFITGNSDESTMKRAQEVKPIGFIIKPIDDFNLLDAITEIESKIRQH